MALPKTFTGGERLFAEDLNGNFEALDTRLATAEFDIDTNAANLDADNLVSGTVAAARMPAWSTLQVAQDTSSTLVYITSDTWTDTGLELSVTPRDASSKFLVTTSLNFQIDAGSDNDVNGQIRIVRDGSEIVLWNEGQVAFTGRLWVMSTNSKLDVPATGSAITYKVQARITTVGNGRDMDINYGGGTSTLTVTEFAG